MEDAIHVPPYSSTHAFFVLHRLTLSACCCALFRCIPFLIDDATPFYTSVVISLLFFVAGGTGWCEAGGLLPRDSLRVGLVGAFGGKALLWQAAAAATVDPSLGWNHQMMARLATATAASLSLSVLLSNRDYGRQHRRQDDVLVEEATPLDAAGDYPCSLFSLHVASWVFVC
jgi:hypothetical protein